MTWNVQKVLVQVVFKMQHLVKTFANIEEMQNCL